MRNKKILCIISMALLSLFIFDRVLALTITGDVQSNENPGAPSPYKGGAGGAEYPNTNALTHDKTEFVGVLATVIDYQNTNGPEEIVLKKVLYTTGSTGSYTTYFETENYLSYDDWNHYITTTQGDRVSCDGTHYYNKRIAHHYFTVSYAAPSRSPNLQGVAEDNRYSGSIPESNIAGFIKGTLIPAISNEYYSTSPHQVMGYTIEETEFDKYYLKYEPVYRTYPSLLKASDVADSGYLLDSSTGGKYSTASENPLAPQDVIDYINEKNASHNESLKYTRKKDCGHQRADSVRGFEKAYNTNDEETCNSRGNLWDDNGCYTYVLVWKDNPDVMLPCYAEANISFITYVFNSVGNTMGTVREDYTSKGGVLFSPISENKHNAVDENTGLLKNGDDYYIGTTPNNAMAISDRGIHKFDSTKHKYILVENGHESYSPNKTLGMGLFNLSEILNKKNDECTNPDDCPLCTDVCSSYAGDKSSDEYLRCAQSYCDSNTTYSATVYATDLKRSCILDKDKCDYHPKTPIDCDNPADSTIKDKSLSDGTDGKTINDSSCGYVGDSQTNDNRTVNKERGSYYYCQRMGSGIKSTDENSKTYYKYGVSNTTDSYINIECAESAGFDFQDLSQKQLKPGEGFEYATYMSGNRTCRIFFDTVSWQFDFASTHSYDALRKKLLLQKLEAFNLLEGNKSGGVKVNGSELLGRVIEQEGTTDKMTLDDVENELIYLSSLGFNVTDSKTYSKSKVTEYVKNAADTSGNSVYEDGERFNLDINERSSNASYNSKTITNGLKLYHDYVFSEKRQLNEEGARNLNEYTTESYGMISYHLPNICIATDNRRTLKRASEESCDGLGVIFNKSVPLRNYYTSLKAEFHDTLNNMNNMVSVKKSYFNDLVSETDEYLKGEDTCPYIIDTDDDKLEGKVSCEIFIEKSGTCYKSNNVYISSNPNVTARLIVHNSSDDIIDIDSQKIEIENSSISGEKSVTFPAKQMNTVSSGGKIVSDTKVSIKGTLQVHSNDSTVVLTSNIVTCKKSLNVIKSASSCTITKDGTSYWITPNGSGDVYATMGSRVDTDGNLSFNKLTHVNNGKYLYQVVAGDENETIIAKVMNGTNTNYCTYIPTNCPELSACKELFTYDQSKKMREYCSENYKIDKYHYDSPEACINDCSTSCVDCDKTKKYCILELTAKEREDFDTVHTFCNSTDSAEEYDDCMNECLNINQRGSGKNPIYRPINLNNPFPSSKFSAESGYQGGKRAIGQEWLIHYNKLIEDKEQVMNGTEPEYVVDLDIARISAIRMDTNTRNDGLFGGSIYSDTTNLPKIASCTSTGYNGYCSSFIHEDFTDYFKIVMGHKN